MVLKVAENRRHTGMILIDLQKAFDTLDHKISLDKNETHRFFRQNNKRVSFLPYKQGFFHFIGQCVSGSKDHKLQSSSRICIRTFIVFAVNGKYIRLYEDDTSSFHQHKNFTEIEKVLNKRFTNVWEWFVDNKLSVYFGEKKKQIHYFQLGRF